jgi:TRAP-type uncharacterized transport system substrate-binding protein
VATSKLDEPIVASLTKAVLQNVAVVRGSLPALAELDRERMIADALLTSPQFTLHKLFDVLMCDS